MLDSNSISSNQPIGVVLFNLGGPDSLEAVRPFLYNLFSDPDLIRLPSIFRKPLAWLIAALRSRKSRVYFESMGGKSPLKELTLLQAEALQKALSSEFNAQVVVAMRYWKPFTQEAIKALTEANVQKVILLPLYPQYSYTTTRSSRREWDTWCHKLKTNFETVFIEDYHANDSYVSSIIAQIEKAIIKFPEDKRSQVHLLFSAHGIPIREIKEGDPYQKQIILGVEKIMDQLQHRYPHRLAYQSKVGPLEWLKPNTVDVLKEMAAEGVKQIVAVPISFVSDHSETLYELKKQYGALAQELGIEQYELMPALNSSERFINALKELVLEAAKKFGVKR